MHFPQTRSSALASSSMAGKALPIAAGVVVAAVASALLNRWLAKKAERRNPPVGRIITVDGIRLHYVERGTGTPLVLLHGNGSMIEDFQSSGLIDLAAKKYRVIAIDRPGFGHSDRPRSTIWTPEAQADLIAAALKKISVQRAIVLGHSWGTLVALAPLLTLRAVASLLPSFRATPSPSEVPLPSPRSPSFASHASQSNLQRCNNHSE